jgi:hypothetical protein
VSESSDTAQASIVFLGRESFRMQVLSDGVPVRAPDMQTERIIDRRQRNERRQSSERRKPRGLELEAPVEQPVEPWPVQTTTSWNRVVLVSLGTFVFGVLLTMTIDRLTRHVRADVVARPIASPPTATMTAVAQPAAAPAPAPIVEPLSKPLAEPEPAPAPTPEPAPAVVPAPAVALAPAAAPSTAIDLRPRRQPVAARTTAVAPGRARRPTAPAKWDPDADLGPLGSAPAKPARARWVDPFAE